MKRKTKKSKNSPSLNKFAVVLAVALLLLVQGAVAYAEDAAPASSGSSNAVSVPTGSSSGNVSVGSVGVPASSNSANTPSVSAPASSNSGNVSVGSVGVPASSNSSNTGGSVPVGSNSSNVGGGSTPASSNSSNSTTGSTETGAPANQTPVGLGGGGGGGNGSPFGFTFNSTLSQNNAMTSTVVPTSSGVAGGAVVTNTGSCKPYLTSYFFSGRENNKDEVVKLQKFLLEDGYSVDVTGVYDSKTVSAVEAFQLKNSDDVLRKSWGASIPSGDVYITTQLKINDIVCNKKSDYAALSYLGKQYNANLAKNANTSNTGVASTGTNGNSTVAVSGNNSSTTDSKDSQEAAVVKAPSEGFWKKVGGWFSGIFKKNK